MEIHPSILRALGDVPKKNQYVAEAGYGLKYVAPFVKALPAGGRVLEVGSGPGVLLSELARRFPELRLQGIEPVGPGFEVFTGYQKALKKEFSFDMHADGYETFPASGSFDLIFSVNVMEHLPRWRHFLRFVRDRLNEQGKCVILCPNYAVWYEPHFRIPLLGGPWLTKRIFGRYIDRFERENGCPGLWSSLNFVTWPEVRRECGKIGLRVKFHAQITAELVERLTSDPEFAARQRWIAGPAKLAKKAGALRLLSAGPMRRFQPYMFLEITK